jgi:hypothetical protein
MWSALEYVAPNHELQSTVGCRSDPFEHYSNDQILQSPFGNELLQSNGVGDNLPGDCSGLKGGLLLSSPDVPGFAEEEGFHPHPTVSEGGGENKPATNSRSTFMEREGKAKRTKPRLLCTYPGCKWDFPRNFELERHKRNVHDRDFRVPCFVYECKRNATPFHRADKLREHLRTHHNPHFSCFIHGCGIAPLGMVELKDHLLTKHNLKHSTQRHLDTILGTLRLRRTHLPGDFIRLESNDRCPLAFLGCDFRSSRRRFGLHLESHELVQRSEGYETILGVCGSWVLLGPCTCPVCHKKVTWESLPKELRPTNGAFLEHHWKEERAAHAVDLFKMLRPYLLAKEIFCQFTDEKRAITLFKIRAELQKTGAIGMDGIFDFKTNTLRQEILRSFNTAWHGTTATLPT